MMTHHNRNEDQTACLSCSQGESGAPIMASGGVILKIVAVSYVTFTIVCFSL